MGFQEWEDRIDNRISNDIISEFKEAVRNTDVVKMNDLHKEWHLFFDDLDNDENIYFAKVEDGVMLLPDEVCEAVNKEVRYKWILKNTANLYLVEKTPEAKYMEDAVESSDGVSVDKRLMFVKDIIVFDDVMQNVFNWQDEDIAVIYTFQNGFRIDKF